MRIYKVRISVSATDGGTNLDYGTELHEMQLPDGCDEQTIFNGVAQMFHKLNTDK